MTAVCLEAVIINIYYEMNEQLPLLQSTFMILLYLWCTFTMNRVVNR